MFLSSRDYTFTKSNPPQITMVSQVFCYATVTKADKIQEQELAVLKEKATEDYHATYKQKSQQRVEQLASLKLDLQELLQQEKEEEARIAAALS